MASTNINIFREKEGTIFKKSLGTTEFYEKMGQVRSDQVIVDFFVVINSKLSHFDKNLRASTANLG
jgi:hypothetical protein